MVDFDSIDADLKTFKTMVMHFLLRRNPVNLLVDSLLAFGENFQVGVYIFNQCTNFGVREDLSDVRIETYGL